MHIKMVDGVLRETATGYLNTKEKPEALTPIDIQVSNIDENKVTITITHYFDLVIDRDSLKQLLSEIPVDMFP